jgi:hypothetical protein
MRKSRFSEVAEVGSPDHRRKQERVELKVLSVIQGLPEAIRVDPPYIWIPNTHDLEKSKFVEQFRD